MTSMRRMAAAVLALLLVVAACGDDQPSAELPSGGDAAVSGPAAGACPEGTPDCNDTPFGSDVPDGLPLDDSGGGDGALPAVETALADAAGSTGLISVRGFYVDSGDGPRLCEALAESVPPQCGGASIRLADETAVDPESIRTEGGTSWSDDVVLVIGEVDDGVLVPAG